MQSFQNVRTNDHISVDVTTELREKFTSLYPLNFARHMDARRKALNMLSLEIRSQNDVKIVNFDLACPLLRSVLKVSAATSHRLS